MTTVKKLKIALLTNRNDHLIAEIIPRIKEMSEISFKDIIYCKEKRGGLFVLMEWVNQVFIKKIRNFLEKIILYPKVEEDLFTLSSRLGISAHQLNNIYSQKNIDFFRSLNLDLLIVHEIKTLKKPILDIPFLGSIKLHQGEIQKYCGDTPGFGELWNNEEQIGATVHFIRDMGGACDIVIQKFLPIFEYDNLTSVKAKISELSLEILPEAIKQVACQRKQRIPQFSKTGNRHPAPTLYRR